MNTSNDYIIQEEPTPNRIANKITTVLLIIYGTALVWILLFKLGVRFSYMEERMINLIPFREFLTANGQPDFGETIMNVVIFVPLGVYTAILFNGWTLRKQFFFFFLVSFLFEILQFILRIGAFDLTDIVTNTCGGIIGLLLFKGLESLFNNSLKAQRWINIIAAIGTITMILMLFLLKMNMLLIRYQ